MCKSAKNVRMQLSSNLYLLIDIMDPLCKYMVKYNIIEFSCLFIIINLIIDHICIQKSSYLPKHSFLSIELNLNDQIGCFSFSSSSIILNLFHIYSLY